MEGTIVEAQKVAEDDAARGQGVYKRPYLAQLGGQVEGCCSAGLWRWWLAGCQARCGRVQGRRKGCFFATFVRREVDWDRLAGRKAGSGNSRGVGQAACGLA